MFETEIQNNLALEYNKRVSGRLKREIKSRGIEQAKLSEQVQKLGFTMSPAKLSKMLNTGSGMTLGCVAALCELMGLDMNRILSTKNDDNLVCTNDNSLDAGGKEVTEKEAMAKAIQSTVDFEDDPLSLISSPNDNPRKDVFNGYAGKYYIYFFKTKSFSEGYHEGILTIDKSNNGFKYQAEVVIPIKNQDGKTEPKSYTGKAAVSMFMDSLYIVLGNTDIGEIVTIILPHRKLNYDNLRCTLGAVATTSTGETHYPTMQRVLVSDKKITPDLYYYLEGEMLMNENEILLKVDDYKRFLKELGYKEESRTWESNDVHPNSTWEKYKQEYRAFFATSEDPATIPGITPIEYYSIPESIIRESKMSTLAKAQVISRLRAHSVSVHYNKIGKKGAQRVYTLVNEWCKNTETPVITTMSEEELVNHHDLDLNGEHLDEASSSV